MLSAALPGGTNGVTVLGPSDRVEPLGEGRGPGVPAGGLRKCALRRCRSVLRIRAPIFWPRADPEGRKLRVGMWGEKPAWRDKNLFAPQRIIVLRNQ